MSSWQPESIVETETRETASRDFPPGSIWVSGTAYDGYEPDGWDES